jgi:hypothetical protein
MYLYLVLKWFSGVLHSLLAGNDYTILGAAITFTFVPTAADVVSVTISDNI